MQERTRVLAVTSVALLLSVLVWFNYSAVLPLVVEDWGLSGVHAGIVFGAFQAGYLLAIVPMGSIADRHSPRWVIAIGATGTGLASLGFAAVAVDFLSGTVLRFLAGASMAGVYVPGMRFVSDWFDAAERGRAMGVYVGTYSLSSGLSFLLASTIAVALDWRVAIGATSVGALAVAPLVLGLTRDNPDAASRETRLDLSVLRNRRYLAAVSVYSWHNWELFGVRNWMLAFLVTVPAVASTGSDALAGLLVAGMMAVGGLGNLAGGWLSDRVGRLRVVGLALGTSALLSLVFGTLGGLSMPTLVAVLLVYGVAITADSAPTSTAITELVDDEHVGTALSVQSLVGFTTTVVSPVVFGVALDAAGYAAAFPTLAAGAALGLVSVAVLSRLTAAEPPAPDSSPAG